MLPLVGIRRKTSLHTFSDAIARAVSTAFHSRSTQPFNSNLPLVGLTHNPLPYTLSFQLLDLLCVAKTFVSTWCSQSSLVKQVRSYLVPQLGNVQLLRAIYDQQSCFIADSTHQEDVLYLESASYLSNLPDSSSKMVNRFFKVVKKFGCISKESSNHHTFDNILEIDGLAPTHYNSKHMKKSPSDQQRKRNLNLAVELPKSGNSSYSATDQGWLDLSRTFDSQFRVSTANVIRWSSYTNCQQVAGHYKALSLQLAATDSTDSGSVQEEVIEGVVLDNSSRECLCPDPNEPQQPGQSQGRTCT